MAIRLGDIAPDFNAETTQGAIDFHDWKKDSWAVLFSHPKDFTPVCTTELGYTAKLKDEFAKRNVEVLGVSVDSQYSHFAWRQMPKQEGGIGRIGFPLVADLDKNIARSYGVLFNESVALRGLFLIDRGGVVRHAVINDLPLGRNVDEALRMVDALQFFEQHGEVCPANWKQGQAGMKPTADGVAAYLSKNG